MLTMSRFETALVCLNGHLVNAAYHAKPRRNVRRCERCGVETISRCYQCKEPIRGDEHVDDRWRGYVNPLTRPPAFCHDCGDPYPWTEAKRRALADVIDELQDLDPAERYKLKASIGDLIAQTPGTDLAVVRVKRAIAKVGERAGKLFAKVVTDVACETARRAFGL